MRTERGLAWDRGKRGGVIDRARIGIELKGNAAGVRVTKSLDIPNVGIVTGVNDRAVYEWGGLTGGAIDQYEGLNGWRCEGAIKKNEGRSKKEEEALHALKRACHSEPEWRK
jgi:hypothetical protein